MITKGDMLSLSGHVRLTSKEQGRIYIYLVNYENLTGNAKNSGYRKLSRFVWSVTEMKIRHKVGLLANSVLR